MASFFELRRLKLRIGEEFQDEIEIGLEPIVLAGQRYIPVPEKAKAELIVDQASGGKVFRLRFDASLFGPCFRCLTDAEIVEHLDVTEYQAADPKGDEELKTPYLADDRLDLSAWARDALVLALPEQILCKPDCAGLCPLCGKDLNAEPHEHDVDRTDPRWAALAALREQLDNGA
jgi:uncharacterized protein